MAKIEAKPDIVQFGDTVIVNNNEYQVKFIDGPDRIGTYDFYLIDKSGQPHIEFVTGTVTICM
jgi:hypothetical protein